MQDCIPETEQLRSTSEGPSAKALETVRRSQRTAARPKHAAPGTPATAAGDSTGAALQGE